ncbi:MAG: SDR family NAD(P)-dependent oxidoreductase [Pseudomonadota bacterium]
MANKNSNYQGKNIWLIGASFGIGEELYRQFSEAGAKLIISGRSLEKLQQIIGENKNHLALPMDVTDENSVNLAVEKLQQNFAKIDLIIFCAGIYQPMNVDNFDLKKSKEISKTNYVGMLNLLAAILPIIKQKKLAHLAIISSVASYFGMNNSLSYGASKAALSNLTMSLYLELKKYDVKVQLINPGFVKTRLTDQNNFKMPLMITPQKAAEVIIKELGSNKFEIFFPKIFVWMMKIIGLLPYKMQLKILLQVK